MAKDLGLLINEYGVFRVAAGGSPDAKDKSPKSLDKKSRIHFDDRDGTTSGDPPDSTAGEYVVGRTEEDVYAAVGLPWFAPEIREARQEFAWAKAGTLPKLIEVTDLVGDLHMHTTASDGRWTPETLVEPCGHPQLAVLNLRVTPVSGCAGFQPVAASGD